ncbi:unnamed protein product [Gulo gulo]|uniref:CB1 cannabinoid receptor-interacting protein 1 n=1 Tax=Gulo gulo TaxID=48420 RepID=A0A9X9LC98_GULGU|nr:unnamed protein product [Gulo gulo]
MTFTVIGTLNMVWQVKFYIYHKQDHCQCVRPFSVTEYECKPNKTCSLMWMNKESFLSRWVILMLLYNIFKNLL